MPAYVKLIDGKRQCTACKEWKPFSTPHFYSKRTTKFSGLTSRCAVCIRAVRKRQYAGYQPAALTGDVSFPVWLMGKDPKLTGTVRVNRIVPVEMAEEVAA